MIIYSESFHVEHSIEDKWIVWIKEVLIPAMYGTGKFQKAISLKVSSHTDETGNTYSIQYYTENKGMLDSFYKEDASSINKLIYDNFQNSVLSFKTELDILDIFEF